MNSPSIHDWRNGTSLQHPTTMIFITLSQMFTVAYRIVIYLQQRQRFTPCFECEKTQLRWFSPKNPPDLFLQEIWYFFLEITQGGSQPDLGSGDPTLNLHLSCRSAEKLSPPKKTLKQFGFYGHFFRWEASNPPPKHKGFYRFLPGPSLVFHQTCKPRHSYSDR